MTGYFIAFEGGEGAGKSTQCDLLARRIGAVRTREPGGTPFGERLRHLFLDRATGHLDARTEALLMAADRAQHVHDVIAPALRGGRHVVTDRYLYSSVAYQAHARGLDPGDVRELSLWATGHLVPHVVVFLDLTVAKARERMAATELDRMEAEDVTFHERVRQGFWAQADADASRWVVLDASADAASVAEAVWSAVVARLPGLIGR